MSSDFIAALLLLLNASRADAAVPAFREEPVLSARASLLGARLSRGAS